MISNHQQAETVNITPETIIPDEVKLLEAEANKFATPCGDGTMIWRRWGHGTPVLLLHGGSGSWTHWIKNIPVLKREFEVWALDIPGLGDSALPSDPTSPQSSAEAVAAGLRELIPAERNTQLVGFSFGAQIGTYAASLLGNHIKNFLIIGTSALSTERPLMTFPRERSTMTSTERAAVHRRVLELLMISRPERIDDLAVYLQGENIRKGRFRSRPHSTTTNVRDGLANVHVPLRTIWGDKDVVAYPDLETVLGILAEHHPELESKIIPDSGHWVMYEQHEAFNKALIEFLKA